LSLGSADPKILVASRKLKAASAMLGSAKQTKAKDFPMVGSFFTRMLVI